MHLARQRQQLCSSAYISISTPEPRRLGKLGPIFSLWLLGHFAFSVFSFLCQLDSTEGWSLFAVLPFRIAILDTCDDLSLSRITSCPGTLGKHPSSRSRRCSRLGSFHLSLTNGQHRTKTGCPQLSKTTILQSAEKQPLPLSIKLPCTCTSAISRGFIQAEYDRVLDLRDQV